jgi:hypothetical protein
LNLGNGEENHADWNRQVTAMMTTRDCRKISSLRSVINSIENGGESRECVVEDLVQGRRRRSDGGGRKESAVSQLKERGGRRVLQGFMFSEVGPGPVSCPLLKFLLCFRYLHLTSYQEDLYLPQIAW